jgi:hypothetical protein
MTITAITMPLLNPSVRQRVPFADTLLYINNIGYFHPIAQFQYHTGASIKYIENYLHKFGSQKDVFSNCCPSKSTNKVSEALKTQVALVKQNEWESDPSWNNFTAAAKNHCIDEHKIQIKAGGAQHVVDKSNFNFFEDAPPKPFL